MLIYSFITDYQAFNLRYKDNTTRDKNETKVDKQSANLGKNNEPIQNRLSFLIDCKSVILHHLAILSFPMVRPAWDNWGIHIIGTQYNIAGHHLPLLFGDNSSHYRYEGWGAGGGISYGYHFLLSNRWSLEANIGVGYVRLHYDKFRCKTCGEKVGTENRNYFGPTKAAISLIFLIK